MSTNVEVVPVIQFYADISGKALDDGFVYIGTSGLDPVANPISVFWDEALTQPAPNPVRTRNGHPDRTGAPSRFFVNADSYSFLVTNKNGSTVHSALDSLGASDLERRLRNITDPAKGAGMVGWTRAPLADGIDTAHKMLDAQSVSVWEFESLIISKPNPNDPSTWDWAPAFEGAKDSLTNGGTVVVPPGRYRGASTLINIDNSVKTTFVGYGATLLPDAGVQAIVISQAPSNPAGAAVLGFSVDGQDFAGTAGLVIDDHSGAVARDIRIDSCRKGLHIKDTTGWSESSCLDNFYINDCEIFIEFENTGGTGSFGYSSWGLIHCDNIGLTYPSAIGFKLGVGCFFPFSFVSQLVLHTQGTSLNAMEIHGTTGRNCRIRGVFEGFGVPVARNGIRIEATSDVDDGIFEMVFVGSWTNRISNPSSKEFILQDRGRDFKGFAATNDVHRFFVETEDFPRLGIRPGRIQFSDGTGTYDTNLFRVSANILGTDDEFAFFANTSFQGRFTHANTATRIYTFPNGSGTVGLKVAVPATVTSAGVPGDWAADTSFFYVYTGDGTTHSWRRVAIAAF